MPPEATRAITKEPRESNFYLLPKIHKPDIPGRPIVSACSCPTVQISDFLDKLCRPLVEQLPSYIKDTNHALQLFQNFHFPDPQEPPLLFTMDITSLYTNIPHKDGLIALKHFLGRSTFNIHVPTILRLAELVLTLNSFQFGDSHFQQTSRVAMGTGMGPSYACLFVGYVESQISLQYSGPEPALFRRYIDDCVGIWTGNESDLLSFISYVNDFHPSLKFTYEISDSTLPFLDIKLMIQPGSQTIATSVHYKNTDSHSYLLYSSSHPNATKRAIPFSQFCRLKRLCSSENDFDLQATKMKQFFRERGYPEELVQQALSKAKRIPREEALTPKTKGDQEDRPILALTYHPHNTEVRKIVMKNFPILQSSPKLSETFELPPLMAFKRDRNLGDLLVRSAFQPSDPPQKHTPGNSRCERKNCKCCPFINTTTTIVKGPSGRQFSIRSNFTCQTCNVVYVVNCSLCGRAYVGETYRTLEERCKEHRDSIIRNQQTPVGVHFNTGMHSISHFSISAVWRNSSGDYLKRKFMEKHIINHLGTTVPDGLNIKD